MTEGANAARTSFQEWMPSAYPAIWESMASAWRAESRGGRCWLMNAANYLFNTGGVRWAVDPTYGAHVMKTPDNAGQALAGLELVLLTHTHADHYDVALLNQLGQHPDLVLAVPDFMAEGLLAKIETPDCDLRVVKAGDTFEIRALRVRAFASSHYDARQVEGEPRVGVHEMGYDVSVGERTLLLPGDVRDYGDPTFTRFKGPDWLFAHLWLGRGVAESFEQESLDVFCDFVARFESANCCLAHLHEISRDGADYWSHAHAGLVMDGLMARRPCMPVVAPRTGMEVQLWD